MKQQPAFFGASPLAETIRRFTIGGNNAKKADCIYSEEELIDAFIFAMHHSTNQAYQLQITLFKSKWEQQENFDYQDIERQLLAIYESNSREVSKSCVQFKQPTVIAIKHAPINFALKINTSTMTKHKHAPAILMSPTVNATIVTKLDIFQKIALHQKTAHK